MRFFVLTCLLAVSTAGASLRNKKQDPKAQVEEKTMASHGRTRTLADACGGCDYVNDPVCGKCLHEERLIVACGECLYTNECFARESGMDAKECRIVGTDP